MSGDELAPGFTTLSAELGEVNELESVCMECGSNGITRLMFTSIPHFREIIVSSFECGNEECGERNTEVKFGGSIQPEGVSYTLKVEGKEDLDRQLVKSENAVVEIPSLEFTVPAGQGLLSTVEGIIGQAIHGLELDQPERARQHPEVAAKIGQFIMKLKDLLDEPNFEIKVYDISGNSFIQNPHFPKPDPQLKVEHFRRTIKQDKELALLPDDAPEEDELAAAHNHDHDHGHEQPHKPKNEDFAIHPAADYNTRRTSEEEENVEAGNKFGYELEEMCFACRKPGICRLAVVDIPHFKETVIMSFKCDFCGFKSNEVKTGGAVGPHGTKMYLDVKETIDLSRDLLKSTTCAVAIPEIEFELSEGSLGSMFTTVEGLMSQILDQLQSVRKSGFALGDSSTDGERDAFKKVLETLEEMKDGKRPFTLVLDDPLGHSYIQSIEDDPKDDPALKIEKYERTPEQDAELGIDILRETENDYAEVDAQDAKDAKDAKDADGAQDAKGAKDADGAAASAAAGEG